MAADLTSGVAALAVETGDQIKAVKATAAAKANGWVILEAGNTTLPVGTQPNTPVFTKAS